MNLSKGTGLGLLLIFFQSAPLMASQTLYSKIAIPTKCEVDYQKGNAFFSQTVQKGFDLSDRTQVIKKFDQALAQYPVTSECRFYFSVGMYDAQSLLQQIVTLEYLLERTRFERAKPLTRTAVRKLYLKRFRLVGLEPQTMEYFESRSSETYKIVAKLKAEMNEAADKKNEAVFLGRFVFVGNRVSEPLTMFDYALTPAGELKTGKNGQEELVDGSYPRLAKHNFERALNVAKAYLDWQPSLFFGEDSFWYGSWYRYFESNPEPSVREVKQEGYEQSFRHYLHVAESLRLETKEYRKVYQYMLNKERAVLEREVGTYEKMYKYRWAPLFIPVGMYVGSALLVNSTWFAALPAETASFSFVGGSLAYGANASAAVSLLTISSYTGLGGYAAFKDYKVREKNGLPFHVTDALDYIVGAAYQSFPLAAIMPVVVGGTVYSAHQVFLSAKSLLGNAISLGRTVQTLGVNGSLEAAQTYLVNLPGQLVQLPRVAVQAWLQSWYKNPKILLSNYGADILMTLVFDCGYRQVNLSGEDACVWSDNSGTHFNKQFLYSLSSTIIVGGLTKPVVMIESFGVRWLTYRGITLLSGVVSQLIVNGAIDSRRLAFDQIYGAGPASVKGETERYIRMSEWVSNRSMTEQAVILIALRALVLSPLETPIKIYFMDRYVKGNLRPVQELKILMKEVAAISIDDYDNSVIENALAALKQDPEVQKALLSIKLSTDNEAKTSSPQPQ